MLIAFEGLDNCGKTTIANMLSSYFTNKGIQVEFTHEFETPVGLLIRELAEKNELDPILKSYLFAADRHWRTRDYTSDDYKQKLIIFDRYYLSAVAYRIADGVDKNWIETLNSIFPKPDITFYIDITPEESIKRNTKNKFNILYSRDFLARARNAYISIIKEYNLVYIDGMQSIDDIYKTVLLLVKEKM